MSRAEDARIAAKLEILARYRAEARGKCAAQLAIEWADSVLASPMRIPPVPTLAEEFLRRMSDPKEPRVGESRMKQCRWHYDRWLSDVAMEINAHGIRLLEELERYVPDDAERLNAVSARIATLLASLRNLKLSWWPMYRIDDHHMELSLLEYCERALGRLETLQIRRGAGVIGA
jgi:hypothetical protein